MPAATRRNPAKSPALGSTHKRSTSAECPVLVRTGGGRGAAYSLLIMLGDTLREQQGEALYSTVERIRQTSIQFRRNYDDDARRELETMLDSLSHDRTIEVVRAFSYFSHLANIAEDQHHMRLSRARGDNLAERGQGTIAKLLLHARESGISRSDFQKVLETILVVPVLTAHPPALHT